MKKFQNSLFVFRRDIRLIDNSGLIEACGSSSHVIPCFIFDPKLLKETQISEFRLNFLLDSLKELNTELEKKNSFLHVFFGKPSSIISKIIREGIVQAIYTNTDYTPYGRSRENQISEKCKIKNVEFFPCHDTLLHQINTIKTESGKPYTVFTHFFKKARMVPVRPPNSKIVSNFSKERTKNEVNLNEMDRKLRKKNLMPEIKGGRSNALTILKKIRKFQDYATQRNYPGMEGTTLLSAHNRFGNCSIREVYHTIRRVLGPGHQLISELFWRDFFTNILYQFPYSYKRSFRQKYSNLPWSQNHFFFEKWSKGETGFPIVDAGMRQLNSSGFMHNRVRMIVASFLTKDLHINWKWGERYFAKKLIDFDPSVNVGNWQWAASTGCDAQPWFRIFNPWLQQKKLDPDCIYIKKWIPELLEKETKDIHDWYQNKSASKYPNPIVDHKEETNHAKDIFKKYSRQEKS